MSLLLALGAVAYGLTTAVLTITDETGNPPVNVQIYEPHNFDLPIPTFGD